MINEKQTLDDSKNVINLLDVIQQEQYFFGKNMFLEFFILMFDSFILMKM